MRRSRFRSSARSPTGRRSLAQLLELRDGLDLKTTAAEIIGAGSTPDFRTVTIDKGREQGLAVDMAVIAPAGVVGRVVMPSPRASKVQLLIDRNAAAGALVARSRAQGVVVGTGETRLRMDYVSTAADVVSWRYRRHVGHRRHLSEGPGHRPHRQHRQDAAARGRSAWFRQWIFPVSNRCSSCCRQARQRLRRRSRMPNREGCRDRGRDRYRDSPSNHIDAFSQRHGRWSTSCWSWWSTRRCSGGRRQDF